MHLQFWEGGEARQAQNGSEEGGVRQHNPSKILSFGFAKPPLVRNTTYLSFLVQSFDFGRLAFGMSAAAVTVTLEDLKNGKETLRRPKGTCADASLGKVSFSTLEEAFGPESLGIIVVKDVPPEFIQLRHRLLSYSSYLGNLPEWKLGLLPRSPTYCHV